MRMTIEQLKFWRKKSKRKPAKKLIIANYKQPAYLYQKQHRVHNYTSLWDVLFQPYQLNFFLLVYYIGILFFIVTFPTPLFVDPFWRPRLDFNGDGAFTITDVFYWLRWLFFVPGNTMIAAFMQFPAMAHFFEISRASYDAIGAFIMTSVYWWATGGTNMIFLWLLPICIQTYLR